MLKILVTGGCGFIGSNLVDRLILEGNDVTVLDNLSSDSNEKFYYNDDAKYIKEDILNSEVVDNLIEGCDHVFHLAAESRIGPTLLEPSKACHVNVVGTCNILQSSLKHKVKSVVYSSSSACYGLSNSFPQKETDKIDNLNPYSATKYAGEDLCSMFYKLWGLNTVCLRYFNVFGERMPTSGIYAPVVGIFLKQKREKNPLTIVGDGLQSRDFVYIQDVVDANIMSSISEKCYGKSYNVGSGKSYKIIEIAKFISENYVHVDQRLGESRNTQADYTKLNQDTGWFPKYELLSWINKQP